MNKSSFSHDHFFRSVFYKPERTAALLRLAAKTSTPLSEFINTVDLSTLQEISESFVTEEDKGTADLAFTVQLKDQKKNAKLLVGIIEEHKSYKDNKIFKQLIRYWHGIMVLKQENIPTVVLIIYNGELEWNPKKEPMFPDYPPYYHQIGLPFICEFIDVGKAFDEEKTEDLDGATIFALLLMKHAFSPEILKKKYYKARDALLSIPKEERTDLIKKTILYLPKIFRQKDREHFMDYVTHQDIYGTPSLYDVLEKEYVDAHKDEWREEGIKEGIKEGIEQGALQKAREMAKVLKEQGIPMEAIAKASGLSEEEIKSL